MIVINEDGMTICDSDAIKSDLHRILAAWNVLCGNCTSRLWIKITRREYKHGSPSCSRLMPRFKRVFSTMDCVAMLAWSSPGTQSALRPLMRCHRVRASCNPGDIENAHAQ